MDSGVPLRDTGLLQHDRLPVLHEPWPETALMLPARDMNGCRVFGARRSTLWPTLTGAQSDKAEAGEKKGCGCCACTGLSSAPLIEA